MYGGQFRGNSQRNDASMEKLSQSGIGAVVQGRNTIASDRFNFAGAEYSFNEQRTMVGAWYAQLEDIYQQTYFHVQHLQPLGDNLVLGANLGYF